MCLYFLSGSILHLFKRVKLKELFHIAVQRRTLFFNRLPCMDTWEDSRRVENVLFADTSSELMLVNLSWAGPG